MKVGPLPPTMRRQNGPEDSNLNGILKKLKLVEVEAQVKEVEQRGRRRERRRNLTEWVGENIFISFS